MLCLRSARTEDGRRVSPRSGGKSEGRWWGTPPRGGAARDSRRRRWRGGRERAGRWRAAWRCTLLSGLALAQKTASKTEIIGLQNLNENHDEASLVHSCIGTVRTLPSQHSNQRTGILVHGLQSPIAVRRTNFTVLFASSPPVSSTQAPGDRACHSHAGDGQSQRNWRCLFQ